MSILPNDQISIPNIEIQEITLINNDPNTTSQFVAFTVFPRDANEPIIFDSLILDEDMFAESVSGTLYFFDPAFIVEQLNFTSYDIVQIKYTAQGATKTCRFKIVEIVSEANSVSKQILGPFGNTIPVAIKFTSDQLIYKNFDTMLLKSFIGRISSGSGSGSAAPYSSQVPNLEKCGSIGGPGFVQYVFQEFGFGSNQGEDAPKQLDADATFNDVWFKLNPSHYPWSKIGVPAKIGQMMNYVCEYACYARNPNAVNFFFWEDLDKFNFKCVESLLEKPVKATYVPSLNENDINAIVDLQIITETPVAKLVNNGAFSGEYVRVKPDWINPYKFVVDTAESLKRTQVVYDYYTDTGFKKISSHPPIDVRDVSLVYSPNRISDSYYGYFQDAYGQSNRPWWNYWDASYKHFEGEKIGGITSEVERIEGNYWQAQFDFCELPATCLKKIYEKIKWPLSKNRTYYAYLKRQDTKWKFYRQSILGERNQPTSFYAILLRADKIYDNGAGGIYSYYFEEIEFWNKRDRGRGFRNQRAVQNVVADKDYPFSIVTVPWGIKGRAYNLNEFLNTTLPANKEESTDLQTSLVSPGASSQVSKSEGTIDGIVMQPVGQFRVKSGTEESPIRDEYVGRVVKIDVISSKMVDLLIPATSFPCGFPPKQETGPMFIFDVENAGVCVAKEQ